MKWLIVGVSGVTCGGKTTIAKHLKEIIPNSYLISQDDYFHPVDSKYHMWIPELNHINWEILSSLDMEKMLNDILNCKKNVESGKDSSGSENSQSLSLSVDDKNETVNASSVSGEVSNDEYEGKPKSLEFLTSNTCHVIIVEGFLIFNYKPIAQLCNLKFYVTLTRDQCFLRRQARTYNPPDVPGYFEHCVWPEYEKQFNDVKKLSDVHFINGLTTTDISIVEILKLISNFFDSENRKIPNHK